MERRNSGPFSVVRVRLVVTIGLGLVLAFPIAGCHGGTRAMATPTRSIVPSGRAFGDSATLGVRILALDRESERATVAARDTKHLIVLAVVPGREIEIIVPGESSIRRGKDKGVVTIDMRRVDDDPRPADADEAAGARLAYDRCVSQAAATARRIAQQKRPVKRDSSGKVIYDGGRGTSSDIDQQRALESSCDRLAGQPNKKRPTSYLPARSPADRYLVVLASASPVTLVQLSERLATLTAVAPDVATTIEAIAAGLYVGIRGSWSGYYVAW